VMASAGVAIGGGIAAKQMDESAGDALHPRRSGRDPPQGCQAADENSPGGTTRRSLGDDEFDNIDDFGKYELRGNDYNKIYYV